MTNEINPTSPAYCRLCRRLNTTFKLWLFLVIGPIIWIIGQVAIFTSTYFLFSKQPIKFSGPYTILHAESFGTANWWHSPTLPLIIWGIWLFFFLLLIVAFIALIIYQTLLYTTFTQIKETTKNPCLMNLSNHLGNLLLIILICHLLGVFTFYLFGVLGFMIFVLNIVFFVKAQEFKNMVRLLED